MHKSEDFAQELVNSGYDFFTGIPCTIIGNLITTLTERTDITYIPAVREDAAVGVAGGAYMAGKIPVVLMPEHSDRTEARLRFLSQDVKPQYQFFQAQLFS